MMNSEFDPRMGWPFSALRIAAEHGITPPNCRPPRTPEDADERTKARERDAVFLATGKPPAVLLRDWAVESRGYKMACWASEFIITQATYAQAIEKFLEWLHGRVADDTIADFKKGYRYKNDIGSRIVLRGPITDYRFVPPHMDAAVQLTDAIRQTQESLTVKPAPQWNRSNPPAPGDYKTEALHINTTQAEVGEALPGPTWSISRFWNGEYWSKSWYNSNAKHPATPEDVRYWMNIRGLRGFGSELTVWWWGVPA